MLDSNRCYFKSDIIAQCVAQRSDCSRCPCHFGTCNGLHDLLLTIKRDYVEMGNYLYAKEQEKNN